MGTTRSMFKRGFRNARKDLASVVVYCQDVLGYTADKLANELHEMNGSKNWKPEERFEILCLAFSPYTKDVLSRKLISRIKDRFALLEIEIKNFMLDKEIEKLKKKVHGPVEKESTNKVREYEMTVSASTLTPSATRKHGITATLEWVPLFEGLAKEHLGSTFAPPGASPHVIGKLQKELEELRALKNISQQDIVEAVKRAGYRPNNPKEHAELQLSIDEVSSGEETRTDDDDSKLPVI